MANIGAGSYSIPKLTAFPGRITLELTNRCNLNCSFCPRKLMEKDLGFMDTGLALRLIDEMAAHLPVSLVPFFRGESLLHPDWIKILAYARTKGVGPIQFTTNTTLMDEKAAEAILDYVDFISFSMDTVKPELYNRTRHGADYERAVANILAFMELKNKKGGARPVVQVSAVETEEHKVGMNDFVAFWQPRVDLVRVYIEHSQDGHPGSIAAPLPDFTGRLPCSKLYTDMVICWNGEVALCNHDWVRSDQTKIVNVKEDGIAGAWLAKGYNKIRSLHEAGELAGTPPCDYCDHWKMYYLPEGYLGKVYVKD